MAQVVRHWRPVQAIRLKTNRYAGKCYWCALPIPVGVVAWWYRIEKLMSHDECHRDTAGAT